MLRSSLPDPSEPTIVALGGILGAFLWRAVGRWRRWPPERLATATADGAYFGAAFGILMWLFFNALEAL